MSGITDLPFRRLVAEFGVDIAVSEMIAGREQLRGSRKSAERACRGDFPGPYVVQLAGRDPAMMAAAARHNADQGADIIDINMGCPAKKVIGGLGGAALMRDEDEAARVIEAVVGAVEVPVTLKMRTGWDDANRNAPRLARLAQDLGVQMLSVHGRTRAQFYDGRADWDFIARVKAAVHVPVIANGDVTDLQAVEKILKRSGADGLMIGRASRGRPWFPAQVRALLRGEAVPLEPAPEARLAVIEAHYDGMLSYYGTKRGLRIARKHLGWYLDDLGTGGEVRAKLLRAASAGEAIGHLRQAIWHQGERRAA